MIINRFPEIKLKTIINFLTDIHFSFRLKPKYIAIFIQEISCSMSYNIVTYNIKRVIKYLCETRKKRRQDVAVRKNSRKTDD